MTLAQSYDALLLDLDGTVYLGGRVIPHAGDAIAAATQAGSRAMYVTNNASRSPEEVAASLKHMGVPARAADVLTSPQVAAQLLVDRHPRGARVLVVGSEFLFDSMHAVGLHPTRLAEDQPVAVVQGHSPDNGWRILAEACIALRTGADWVACNVDSTLPTDRGLLPGNGAMVAALRTATGLEPRVAGKPNRPLLDEAVRRTGATRPLVIGDRLDTDVEAGVNAGMPSLLVLSGVSTPAELLAAPPAQRPTLLAFDLRALHDDERWVSVQSSDREWVAEPGAGGLVLRGPTVSGELDDHAVLSALAAAAAAAWEHDSTTVHAGDSAAEAALRQLKLV